MNPTPNNLRQTLKRHRTLLWLLCSGLFVLPMLALLLSNAWILWSTRGRSFSNTKDLPYNDVGLVLGTSRRIANGSENRYFTYRINAAAALYHAKKVKHLLLSGDNRSHQNNEPLDMKNALIAKGVPAHALTLDYAGFRTLDSIVRSKKIFGQTRLTLISQPFHNPRALYLAKHFGLDAVAFHAKEIPWSVEYGAKIREYFARVKAIIDLKIIDKKPHFLGKKIHIQLSPSTKKTNSHPLPDVKSLKTNKKDPKIHDK